jgi:glycosyltransferase involved in cell wall biosynthesis
MPKVSVIIPTYNCAQYLKNAIDSILGQTFQDFEIIVVDDGSTDKTKEEMAVYNKSVTRVRYIFQENRGAGAARNKGIGMAQGEYIAFLDADDVYMPEMLEKAMKFLADNTSSDIVITEWYLSEAGLFATKKSKEHVTIEDFPENSEILFETLLKRSFLNVCMIAKRSDLEATGGFDESLYLGEDADLWRRIVKYKLRIGIIHEPLYVYRKRKNSITTVLNMDNIIGQFSLFKKYEKEIWARENIRRYYSDVLWDLGRQAYRIKKCPFFIIKCMLKSQLYRPSLTRIIRTMYSVCFSQINRGAI